MNLVTPKARAKREPFVQQTGLRKNVKQRQQLIFMLAYTILYKNLLMEETA
jgi:hypothetical protein